MERNERELHLAAAQRLRKAGNWLLGISGVSMVVAGREFLDHSKILGSAAFGVGIVTGWLARQSYYESERQHLIAYDMEDVPPILEVLEGDGQPSDLPPAQLQVIQGEPERAHLRIVDEPA